MSVLIKLPICVLAIFVVTAFCQTQSQIDSKYGKPVYAYSVSDHIWMTPDYSADGQVCRMRLYPKHIANETEYLSPQLYFEELNGALNRLVSLDERGAKKNSFGLTDFGGGAAWTTYPYEKVTFVFTFSLRIEPGSTKKTESVSFPVDEVLARLPKRTPPSIDDFAPSRFSEPQIVTILWNERKCTR